MSKDTPYVDGWPVMPLPRNIDKGFRKHTADDIVGCVVTNGGIEALVVTATRVYTLMGGFVTKVNQFDLSTISGVEVTVGAVTGDLYLVGAGIPTTRGNAANLAHGIHFMKGSRDDVNALAEKIRAASGTPSTSSAPDPVEQLTRLAQLRDVGAITPDEFAAKKADLLDRI